ncbi:helix-turn-helix domain-containing protein [Aquimarina litoralis]|uniref:helix-turn-helix domain-containing protein n=1 Tax=Aquimarina litoralis TaxID=584605 RepID=UPI001C59B21D|nr:helix-turn-helix transcriptional regulator [Aquimarina litoralis]MBW1297953.1 helix-turn-helix domain-containing protein [Aquimarina litoralis]
MQSLIDFLNILILLGAIQGLITSILLFNFKSNKKANRILSFLILLVSLSCFNIYILETITTTATFWLVLEAIFPLVVIMPIGPLVYFYIKTSLYPDFKLTRKNNVHFYTAVLDLVPYVAAVIFIVGGFLGFINADSNVKWGNFIDVYTMYVDIPRWISLVIYVWFSFKLMSNYPLKAKNKAHMKWVKQFTIGFLIFAFIWGVHLVFYLIPSLSQSVLNRVGWYPIYIPLIGLIYWLGINGIIISLKPYYKSSKTPDLSETIVKTTTLALQQAMIKDQLFLNASLKLDDVVKHIEVPQKTISTVLNQHIGKTFNEFINEYRIATFKKRLLDNDTNNLTITGIAFECGFNSQATFQRTFKTITGVSPKEFQKKHIKS